MMRGDKHCYLQDPTLPSISFPVQSQARKSTRQAQPPSRYGQNVAYSYSRQPRNQPGSSTFRLNNSSTHFLSFESTLRNNETAMEKALHLPTGQMYQCYACDRPGHKVQSAWGKPFLISVERDWKLTPKPVT